MCQPFAASRTLFPCPAKGRGEVKAPARLPQHVSADTNAAMNDKPKKPQKLRARLPRGLEDRGPAAIAATRQMVEKIRAVYERYGFEPVETPAFEYTDALGKFLPDQDLSLIHISEPTRPY